MGNISKIYSFEERLKRLHYGSLLYMKRSTIMSILFYSKLVRTPLLMVRFKKHSLLLSEINEHLTNPTEKEKLIMQLSSNTDFLNVNSLKCFEFKNETP